MIATKYPRKGLIFETKFPISGFFNLSYFKSKYSSYVNRVAEIKLSSLTNFKALDFCSTFLAKFPPNPVIFQQHEREECCEVTSSTPQKINMSVPPLPLSASAAVVVVELYPGEGGLPHPPRHTQL